MIRWGLIGGSDIAATRTIPAMRAAGQLPVAVASSSLPRAEQFASAHQIEEAFADADDLLARDDIDAVYISSLNRLHAPHTLAAAAAGKHVLCEKPVAVNLADADEMVRAASARGWCSRSTTTCPRTPRTPRSAASSPTAGSARSGRSECSSPSNWPNGCVAGG